VKDWIKQKRGLKGKFKEFIEGYRLYYNFIRSHTALNEKTPASTKEKLTKTLIETTKTEKRAITKKDINARKLITTNVSG